MKSHLFLFFSLIIITSFFIWQGVYLPKDSDSEEQILFLIERGEGLKGISQNLEKEGIIKNKIFFEGYIFLKGQENQLRAGGYFLTPSMSVPEIARKIVSGETAQVRVVIPEGFSTREINERLVSLDVIRRDLLALKAGDFEADFWFLNDVPADVSPEGFLFPDTYYFAYGLEPEDAARQMLKNFEKKLDSSLTEAIKRREKSVFEVVVMASLLEKEVQTLEDKKIVSGILWKRLQNRFPLQVDATITYLIGKKTTDPEGEPSAPYGVKISRQDLQIDSPYNTYKYLGLPPGPICNPGLKSIEAAVYPENSNFWYYLSTPDGETIFSKTLEAHNIAKAKYLE